MVMLSKTAKWFFSLATRNIQSRTWHAARSLLAAFLAGALAAGSVSPAFGQNPPQNPPPATAPPSSGANIAPVSSLGVASHSYSRGPRAFPNIFKPYESQFVPPPVLVNSPRIDQLIHDNKLQISLQDAVELALENSMDIAVQRYYPWISDAGLLNAHAGNSGFGTPGVAISSSSASINPFSFFIQNFDPLVTSTTSISEAVTPINNPFTSGAGTTSAASSLCCETVATHQAQFSNQYSQTFPTGTNLTVSWNNTRTSQNIHNFFNPDVTSNLQVQLAQPLLNGFGKKQWTRNIRIANNNRKIADWAFAQQAITTITTTITDYWELVYARENVKVNAQAVAVAQKLYEDNKKQLEIGSLAPLEVTRSESELSTDQQNFIFAQTTQLQDEQTLKNDISKDPLAPNIINVEIIPTDQPKQPEVVEAPTFEEAIKEALAKRPELQEQDYNLKNAEIDVRATKNALLPSLTASAFYESQGLAGNSLLPTGSKTISTGVPIVDANGNPVFVTENVGGVPTQVPIFDSTTVPTGTTPSNQGFTTAQNQVFHNRFPVYAGQLTLTLPLRNRSAQAFHVRSLLVQRQLETQMQQLRNAALLDVRKSYIALTQDRAQVAAASKARQLQQETFDAEQKKYQLGASTVYLVIQTQRDLILAEGNEIRALANLVEAKAKYEQAVGRTLEANHVTVADAKSGEVKHDTLIPGTLHGQVVGADKIFSDTTAGQK